MIPASIRTIALCVFRDKGRLFVFEGCDSETGRRFYRPLGGGIEFGERSEQAVMRELREEIGAEVQNLRFLGALENIFTYEGRAGHEIVFVYDGTFRDGSFYEREWVDAVEDNGEAFRAVWKPLSDFPNASVPLYPDGLWDLLQRDERSEGA